MPPKEAKTRPIFVQLVSYSPTSDSYPDFASRCGAVLRSVAVYSVSMGYSSSTFCYFQGPVIAFFLLAFSGRSSCIRAFYSI